MTEAQRSESAGDPPASTAPSRTQPKTSAAYEFSDEDREGFRSLAASMSFVGVCLMLFGLLLGLFALVALYGGFPWAAAGLVALAVAYAPAAWWTVSGGRSLSGILRTRGRDVELLMEAVRGLGALFAFARAVIIVQTLLITALAAIFVFCTFVLEKGDRCFGAFN